MAKTKKPNMQDATLRNVRALKKHIAELEALVRKYLAPKPPPPLRARK